VVKASQIGGTDVHARASTDRLQTLEDLDLLSCIGHVSPERLWFHVTAVVGRDDGVLRVALDGPLTSLKIESSVEAWKMSTLIGLTD
jgi:hypothetical protein